MNAEQTDARRKRIVKLTKFGLGGFGILLALGVAAPLLIAGVEALLAVAVAGVLGITVIGVAPLAAMRFANWRLREIKAEATRNPIETLQSVFVEKQAALSTFSASITDFQTEVSNFSDKVDGFKKTYPQDAAKFQEQLDKMKELLKLRRGNYKEALKEMELFESEIKRASAIWDMAQAAAAMNKAAGLNEDDILERIKTETAVDSVQKSLNRAFAELETSLTEENAVSTKQTTEARFANIQPEYQKVGVK
jgi:hypothetical protein